ncbi:hypothetical protein E2C01_048033 [Portunus trituberculatus]|uniref:Uncharacterized protein n=1 Tax=Portunus trituberculatus TaxID=210409 RepID=A0A5B7G9G4_PORTR|nr:hypothetical protein [Portunus trituberculatus]
MTNRYHVEGPCKSLPPILCGGSGSSNWYDHHAGFWGCERNKQQRCGLATIKLIFVLDLSGVDSTVSGDVRDNKDGNADGSASATLHTETEDSEDVFADANSDSEAGDGEGDALARILMRGCKERTTFILQTQKAMMWEGLKSSFSSSLENDGRDSVKMTFADRRQGESGGASATKDDAPDKREDNQRSQILPTSARQSDWDK